MDGTVETVTPQHPLAPVALVAPFSDLAEIGRAVLREFPQPVEIRVGDMARGLAEVRGLVRQGVEVIISRGGTANLIRTELGLPVVEVRTSAYDILTALKPLLGTGKKIGFIGSPVMFLGAERMRGLFDMDVTLYAFTDFVDMPALVRRAVADGIEVMIGGRRSVRHAREAGMDVVLLSSGHEAVLTAFHEAYHMLEVFRAEAARLALHHNAETRLAAVLNAVADPICIVDAHGALQLSNPAAASLLGSSATGMRLPLHPPDLFERICHSPAPLDNQIGRLGGKPLLLDSTPLETYGKPTVLILGRSVSKIEQSERTVRRAFYLKGHVARYRFTDILGQDPGFLALIERARDYAASSSTVLITGETGTGKELLAQSMHNAHHGPERPFVAVNCATLPETLLESELFGYAGGAFTGARQEGRKGLFELAHGGSILLDEIGEMPLPLQSRLLRVLEEKAVRPVGNDRVIPVEVRLMATTNVNLEQAVEAGAFRRDLYYRLNVLSLTLPPLRERGQDVLHIFQIFARHCNPQLDAGALLDAESRKALLDYDWPGNLRELRNLVEKLDTLTTGFTRHPDKVTALIRGELRPRPARPAQPGAQAQPAPQVQDVLEQLLANAGIKKGKLADLLGVSRTTLWRRTRKG